MKLRVKSFPFCLVLLNLVCIVLIVYRSEILRGGAFSKESIFVFSSMSMLTQPIPAVISAALSRFPLLSSISTSCGRIFYSAAMGCIQWYLIGFFFSNYFDRGIKLGFTDKINSVLLAGLIMAFFAYIGSLIFIDFTTVRNFAERMFFICWALFIIFLPIYLFVRVIFPRIIRDNTMR